MNYDFKSMAALLSAFSGALLFSTSTLTISAQNTPENAQRPLENGETITYQIPPWVNAREQDEKANDVLHLYQRGRAQGRITDYEVYKATFGRQARLTESSGAQPAARYDTLNSSSDLIGMHVQDAAGNPVGDVTGTVFDWPRGKIAYAVIAPTGTETDNYYAVPPLAFHRSDTDSRTLILNVDRNKLNAGPSFNRANWPDPSNQAFLDRTYQYYGLTPYWQ